MKKKIFANNLKIGDVNTIWGYPNYDGLLYTADQVNTPLLTMIGGLNGGKQTTNFEFPTASLYVHSAATQPAITENQSVTGVAKTHAVRTQEKNVTQIFMRAVEASYVKMSNPGRLSGINTAGAQNNAPSELDFQKMVKLQEIARDINYTFHNGAYQISTDSDVANKTRGMLAAIVAGGSTVNAAAARLSKTLVDYLLRTMYANGARFQNVIIFCNAFQKQMLSNIYGYSPMDRNVGGINIKQIETDFGNLGIQLDANVPAATIGFYEMSYLAPVFQPVPGKGNLFYESLSRSGASESGQIFGQVGLDHGPEFVSGSITNLATS